MLYSVYGKKVTTIPYYKSYLANMKKIDPIDLRIIKDHLKSIIDNETAFNSSYIPPHNWKGSIFYPIREALADNETAAKFYGILLWELVMEDDHIWMFTQSDKTKGKYYFRPDNIDNLAN